jgi:hypothetical protein
VYQWKAAGELGHGLTPAAGSPNADLQLTDAPPTDAFHARAPLADVERHPDRTALEVRPSNRSRGTARLAPQLHTVRCGPHGSWSQFDERAATTTGNTVDLTRSATTAFHLCPPVIE